MKLKELYEQKETVFSVEVFPPNKNSSMETVLDAVTKISKINPDYFSVTYGAGGNVANRSTCEIASFIKNKCGIEAMAHLTCVGATKETISAILDDLSANGIDNILALRGDKKSENDIMDFKYASELTEFILSKGNFDVAGACYPETHIEAASSFNDIMNLKKKVDCGASHLISQLFFENKFFYEFLEKARIAGINVPVSAGIMPVTNKKQIERMVTMCGASLPQKFVKMVSRYENNPEALVDAGIAYAVDQIVDLITNGVEGIHLYTMNNPYVAMKIHDSVKNLL